MRISKKKLHGSSCVVFLPGCREAMGNCNRIVKRQRVSVALPLGEQTKPGVAHACFCGKGIRSYLSVCLFLFPSLPSFPPSRPPPSLLLPSPSSSPLPCLCLCLRLTLSLCIDTRVLFLGHVRTSESVRPTDPCSPFEKCFVKKKRKKKRKMF